MSFLEQVIEDVVGGIIPDSIERFLGDLEPCFAFQIRIDGHAHMSMLRQWQGLLKNQLAVLVYCVNRRDHS
jgi:hypothetical protein